MSVEVIFIIIGGGIGILFGIYFSRYFIKLNEGGIEDMKLIDEKKVAEKQKKEEENYLVDRIKISFGQGNPDKYGNPTYLMRPGCWSGWHNKFYQTDKDKEFFRNKLVPKILERNMIFNGDYKSDPQYGKYVSMQIKGYVLYNANKWGILVFEDKNKKRRYKSLE